MLVFEPKKKKYLLLFFFFLYELLFLPYIKIINKIKKSIKNKIFHYSIY